MAYDIFISYRREGGGKKAERLYHQLKSDKYKVSFDEGNLGSGNFGEELLKRIKECTDFIIVLNQGVFDKCFDSEYDWLRIELANALKEKKNIIPVMLEEFTFPDNLPADIVEVKEQNGLKYNTPYFYDELKKCLDTNNKTKKIFLRACKITGVMLLVVVMVLIGFIADRWCHKNTLKKLHDEMVFVEGGAFTMGCISEQGARCEEDDENPHEVILTGFCIGKYEVTQAQWNAVMNRNKPFRNIHNKGKKLPVEHVSWSEIVGTKGGNREYMDINGMRYYENGFIYKLNKMTKKRYRLPTEAEWEYAARGGGKRQKNYIYSGSDTAKVVGWYCENSGDDEMNEEDIKDSAKWKSKSENKNPIWQDHLKYYGCRSRSVGELKANDLRIHDMSGNVWEWCYDRYYERYDTTCKKDPVMSKTGGKRVIRGGAWDFVESDLRVSRRFYLDPDSTSTFASMGKCGIGFRLVHDLLGEMVSVEGGSFTIGCTDGQYSEDENPYEVVLSDFCIGKYEVTQAQWKTIMDTNPSSHNVNDSLPVEGVSWEDIVGTKGKYMKIKGVKYYENGFIYKLNETTVKQYRLPTEAEWEYAARGGKKRQKNYIYSGSDTAKVVGRYCENSGDEAMDEEDIENPAKWKSKNENKNPAWQEHLEYYGCKTRPVGGLKANDLGIYDMSGNVWEWCYDSYHNRYDTTRKKDPIRDDDTGKKERVIRGGAWDHKKYDLRVSRRFWCKSNSSGYNENEDRSVIGFRLAFDADTNR